MNDDPQQQPSIRNHPKTNSTDCLPDKRKQKSSQMVYPESYLPRPLPSSSVSSPVVVDLVNKSALSFENADSKAPPLARPLNDSTPEEAHDSAFSAEEDGKDIENGSDRSSICRSPTWDNYETRQQQKLNHIARRKRRKDRERADTNSKTAEKTTTRRLVKPPPAYRHLKMIEADRSQSLPSIPNTNTTTVKPEDPRRSRISQDSNGFDFNQEASDTSADQKDASSQRRSFQSMHVVRHSDGFIGGMKLKNVEQDMQVLASQAPDREELVTGNDRNQTISSPSSNGAPQNPDPPVKPRKRLQKSRSRIPQTCMADYGHTGTSTFLASSDTSASEGRTPTIDRDIQRGHKTQPSITKYIFPDTNPQQDEQQVHRENDTAGQTLQHASKFLQKKAVRPPRRKGNSPDRPPISYREPAALSDEIYRGRTRSRSIGSVSGNYQQAGSESETEGDSHRPKTSDSQQRGRAWSIRSLGRRIRSLSRSKRPESGGTTTTSSEPSTTCHIDEITKDPLRSGTSERRSADLANEPRLKRRRGISHIGARSPFEGLKNAAVSAFSRHTPTANPRGSFGESTQNKLDPSADASISIHGTTEQRSADILPTTIGKASLGHVAIGAKAKLVEVGNSRCFVVTDRHDNASLKAGHARSTSRHTEDFHKQPFSNITTPDGCRPQSQSLEDGSQRTETLSVTVSPKPEELSKSGHVQVMSEDTIARKANERSIGTKSDGYRVSSLQELQASLPKLRIEQNTSSTSGLQKKKRSSVDQDQSLATRNNSKRLAGDAKEPITTSRPNTAELPASSARKPATASKPSGKHPHGSRVSALAKPKIRFPKDGEPTEMSNIDPIAKMLVVCCSCRYFHDMPAEEYGLMSLTDDMVEKRERGQKGVKETDVKCPWCSHVMKVTCCEGYAGVVYLRERLH
ncbi:hypothetical protein BJ878DRAFT_475739 [Calycina marina]|uniref:Uncharacterized protein n=1 Tax=Calycina marina TaxID=1763456 RepID=A0A9P7ZBW0_9HELO|nr:hypothetical protein BJ878DRAFT_475739 [Calycina marina]